MMRIIPASQIRDNTASKNNKFNSVTRFQQNRDSVSFTGIYSIKGCVGLERSSIIKKVQQDLDKSIKENNVKNILEYFNIPFDVNEKDSITLANYFPRVSYKNDEQGYKHGKIYFKEFGINENNLFKKITAIKGNAFFEGSEATNLGEIESIGGRADFRNSKIDNLGKLKSIGQEAQFSNSKITHLENLETIGFDADFRNSQVIDLGNLKSIGWNAYFSDSKITSLKNLESIGRIAWFNNSQIADLGNLKSIGNCAEFSNSKIKSLGKLEYIGASADFSDSQLEDLGALKTIGDDVDFHNSKITGLGQLKSIGDNLKLVHNKEVLIYLNGHINPKDIIPLCSRQRIPKIYKGSCSPKDEIHVVKGKTSKTLKANNEEMPKFTNDKIVTNNLKKQEPKNKLKQPEKEVIENPSFMQRLKKAWRVIIGN